MPQYLWSTVEFPVGSGLIEHHKSGSKEHVIDVDKWREEGKSTGECFPSTQRYEDTRVLQHLWRLATIMCLAGQGGLKKAEQPVSFSRSCSAHHRFIRK
ncbi:unnamed protein product [Caretta caretta]